MRSTLIDIYVSGYMFNISRINDLVAIWLNQLLGISANSLLYAIPIISMNFDSHPVFRIKTTNLLRRGYKSLLGGSKLSDLVLKDGMKRFKKFGIMVLTDDSANLGHPGLQLGLSCRSRHIEHNVSYFRPAPVVEALW